MKTTIIAIAAAAVLASSAWAGSVTCERLGDAVTCSDGTTAMPFGGGGYILKDEPRDAWGSRVPTGHDEHEIREWK